MTFLSPVAALIAAGIAIPALVALYFLKLRRRRLEISSTLLWKRAIEDMQVNAPFQRLRRNLLLLLQLLILLALLLALARPMRPGVAAQGGQRVAIVIDRSASMNTQDGDGGTRLDEAKRRAAQLVDQLGGGGAMVVDFASRARVLCPFTTDRAALRLAIDQVTPTDQPGLLAPALRLIEPFAARSTAGEPGMRVIVLSDGRTRDEEPLTVRDADVQFVQLGRADTANLGMVAFSARRDFDDPTRVHLLARLSYVGPSPLDTQVTWTVDDAAVRTEPLRISPQEDRALTLTLSMPASGRVSLRHHAADALPVDDVAHLIITEPRDRHVLLVTSGNAFLSRVVESVGVARLVSMDPVDYEKLDPATLPRRRERTGSQPQRGGFDVVIFDQYAPGVTPPVDAVYFNAAPPLPGLELVPWREGQRRTQAVLDWQRDHPLLRYVGMDDLAVSQPGRLRLPDGASSLATGQSGPMVALVPDASTGKRHLVISFDLLRSTWPVQVSFAVFMDNAVRGLGGVERLSLERDTLAFVPGDVARPRVPPGLQALRYRGPVELTALPPVAGEASLPMFDRAGLYRVEDEALPPPWDQLAVNLLDAQESDVRPADALRVGSTSATTASITPVTVRREVWRWFAWAALAILLIEWLVYTRRMHL